MPLPECSEIYVVEFRINDLQSQLPPIGNGSLISRFHYKGFSEDGCEGNEDHGRKDEERKGFKNDVGVVHGTFHDRISFPTGKLDEKDVVPEARAAQPLSCAATSFLSTSLLLQGNKQLRYLSIALYPLELPLPLSTTLLQFLGTPSHYCATLPVDAL
ncbi:MAG: hypothetical protein U0411_11910 [Thermodesulfovibrionales bacterium]